MKSFKLALLFGFLVWLFPFLVAILIFPLREHERPLFESIMPVVVTLSTVVLAVRYLGGADRGSLREGILLGLLWLAISLLIDLVMFSSGPMQMTLADYVKDIGVTYLIIPITSAGIGLALQANGGEPHG